jgi:hypothetical protein
MTAALLSAARVSAAPGFNPSVIQCDNSYHAGSNTHAPFSMPITVQTTVQDTAGLRIGAANGTTGTRMGNIAGQTFGLWRFDGAVDVSSGCIAPSSISTFVYTYRDTNGSPPMIVGQCVYNTNAGCAATTLNSTIQAPVNSSCPGTPPAVGASAVSLFNASSHFADAGNATASFSGVYFGSVTYGAANGTVDLPTTYSLSAWINTGTNAAQQRIISAQGPAGYWAFGLQNNNVWLHDSRDGASADGAAAAAVTIHDGTWHKIDVVRIDSSPTGRRYYLDGKLLGTTVAASTTSFSSNPIAHPLMFGQAEGGGDVFTGTVDEVRVMYGARTDDDILLEYYGAIHRYAADGIHFSSAAGTFNPVALNGSTSFEHYFPGGSAAGPNATWTFLAQNINSASGALSFNPIVDTRKPITSNPVPTVNSATQITWNWATAPLLCVAPGGDITPGVVHPYFQLSNCANGAPVAQVADPGRSYTDSGLAGPNLLACRYLTVSDVWGTSSLSASASAYTFANPPASVSFVSISTGGFITNWSANGNPGYTRFEMTYALDPGFTVGLSTRAAFANNFTATSAELTGLTPGTTYYVRVRAFSGRNSDFLGGVATAFASGSVVTVAGAPLLSGTALSNSAVQWTWSAASGASGYTLYDASNLSVLYSGPNNSASFGSYGVNTRHDAQIEADFPGSTPPSARGVASVYTLANAPVALSAGSIGFSSATFSWGANGNPGGTSYELSIASDPAFGLVVSTLSASAPTVVAAGLFPGSTYYARVRAYNGQQIATTFAGPLTFSLQADINISTTAAPQTPYTPVAGMSGSWQFDEGTGTTTADFALGGVSDAASFACVTTNCASTPTFAAGPAGLGTAASFSGLPGGVVVTANGTNFGVVGAGSISLEAWVYPQTAAQLNGAGVAAIGNLHAVDIALDVSGGIFRLVLPGNPEFTVSVPTATIVAGQWTHVVGVLDNAAHVATLYLNGKAAALRGSLVPARSASGAALDIGNRRDGGGTYAFPFFGRIDDVRVFNRALSATDVLAEYTGGFVSSVTAANSGVTVALPPNAFGAPAQIFITADPVNHPIKIPLATLNAGLAVPPSGLTMVPNSLVEVVPVVGGVAFTSTLGSSATLSIPYVDANNDNLIDGTNPPLAASRMQMYTLNTTVNRWELLPTVVDSASRKASGQTPHFSVFALFAPVTLGSSLSGVTAYPIPWKPGSGGRFDGPGVTFAQLPVSGRIRILTLTGQKVRDFAFSGSGAGSAIWDGGNDGGRRVASGVYLARITSDADGSVSVIKIAIER